MSHQFQVKVDHAARRRMREAGLVKPCTPSPLVKGPDGNWRIGVGTYDINPETGRLNFNHV